MYICCNFFYKCHLLQVDNLNLATNLKNYGFYAMLIACKCTPLCKKLNCKAKNEPTYLATTLLGLAIKKTHIFSIFEQLEIV